MPAKGPDFSKIKRIIRVLLRNPDGIWLRKLSRESRLPVSTLHYYLEGSIANLVENVGVRDDEGNFFGLRLVRLKNGVFNQLSHESMDANLRKILTTNEILSNSE